LSKKIPLFFCDWFDPTNNRGTKVHSNVGLLVFMLYKCWFAAAVSVLFFVGFMLYKYWFYAAVLVLFWCSFGVGFMM